MHPIFGRMVVALIGGVEVAGAGVHVPAPELAFDVAFLESGGGVW